MRNRRLVASVGTGEKINWADVIRRFPRFDYARARPLRAGGGRCTYESMIRSIIVGRSLARAQIASRTATRAGPFFEGRSSTEPRAADCPACRFSSTNGNPRRSGRIDICIAVPRYRPPTRAPVVLANYGRAISARVFTRRPCFPAEYSNLSRHTFRDIRSANGRDSVTSSDQFVRATLPSQ